MPSPADDAAEFRRALADVEPLPQPRRKPLERTPPAPVPQQLQRDERAALEESLHAPWSLEDALESGEELVHLREGLPRQLLRKLRRGHWVVEASLDLHGMNRLQAAESIAAFMRACVHRRLRCVRIVHGKGLGSRNREPVLKGKVRRWLAVREEVLAFCQAPSAQGGGGAVLVLLKGRR